MSSSGVRSLLKHVFFFSKDDRTFRHIMNKIAKGFNETIMELAATKKKKIPFLKNQLEEMRAKKSRKVS